MRRAALWLVALLLAAALFAGIVLAWAAENCMCGEAVAAAPYSPPLPHDRKLKLEMWA
mgnify:CR=1 FL=1